MNCILKVSVLVSQVLYETSKTNQSNEFECLMKFPLIHYNRIFGLCITIYMLLLLLIYGYILPLYLYTLYMLSYLPISRDEWADINKT